MRRSRLRLFRKMSSENSFFQGRSLQVLLTPGDLGHLFVLSETIYKPVCKIFFTEYRLAPHARPDRKYRVRSFIMVSRPAPYKITHCRGVKSQLTSYFTLPVSILLNSLSHLFVAFFPIPDYTLVKDFIKRWPVCVPLAFRYL